MCVFYYINKTKITFDFFVSQIIFNYTQVKNYYLQHIAQQLH